MAAIARADTEQPDDAPSTAQVAGSAAMRAGADSRAHEGPAPAASDAITTASEIALQAVGAEAAATSCAGPASRQRATSRVERVRRPIAGSGASPNAG